MNSPGKKRSPMKSRGRISAPAMSPSTSTSSAPSATSSNSHQRTLSSALQNVRSLPRKASRLVCIADKSGARPSAASPKEHEESTPGSQQGVQRGGPAKHPGLVERSPSGSSSGSDPASDGPSTSSSRVLSPSSSSASSVLDGSGVTVQPKFNNQMTRRECLSKPIMPLPKLVEALERDMHISSRPYDTEPQHPLSPGISHDTRLPTQSVDDDPIPRPLSPPNAHFRRQRVLSGSGAGLGPYSTPSPINSPPGSPAPDTRRVFLNDLLSSESLVAQRPRLYNGAEEREDEDDDCRSIMSDVGTNAYAPRFAHQATVAPRPGPGASSPFQHGLGSRWRSRPHVPMVEPQSASGRDEYALRRVFSR